MKFKSLDTVVLNKDLSGVGLRKGDLGAVVQVYEPDGLEVEFLTRRGALVTVDNVSFEIAVGEVLGVVSERSMTLFFDTSVQQGPAAAEKIAHQVREIARMACKPSGPGESAL